MLIGRICWHYFNLPPFHFVHFAWKGWRPCVTFDLMGIDLSLPCLWRACKLAPVKKIEAHSVPGEQDTISKMWKMWNVRECDLRRFPRLSGFLTSQNFSIGLNQRLCLASIPFIVRLIRWSTCWSINPPIHPPTQNWSERNNVEVDKCNGLYCCGYGCS